MKTYIIILLGILLWNCSQVTVQEYNGTANIYFSNWKDDREGYFSGEMNFGFGFLSIMDTVIHIPVTGTGDTTGYDRYFDFTVDSLTGHLGVDIELPQQGILPAGSATGYIPVTLHRIAGDDNIYEIYFRLLPNETFGLSLPEAWVSNEKIDLTRMKLSYSSAITQPKGWIEMAYGYFSLAKYNLFNEMFGKDASYWEQLPTGMTPVSLGNNFKIYIETKIMQGADHALADPQNTAERGYMTMRKATMLNPIMEIPAEWPDADKRKE